VTLIFSTLADFFDTGKIHNRPHRKAAMATFTLRERLGTGIDVPDPNADPALQDPIPADKPGATTLVVDRLLEDTHGNLRGSFTFRGLIARNLGTNGYVIAFDATNELDKGVINTQGVIRTIDPTWTFAITGGTRKYKKAHGTVTRKVINSVPHFTFRVR